VQVFETMLPEVDLQLLGWLYHSNVWLLWMLVCVFIIIIMAAYE
jgi:hypothetical protein